MSACRGPLLLLDVPALRMRAEEFRCALRDRHAVRSLFSSPSWSLTDADYFYANCGSSQTWGQACSEAGMNAVGVNVDAVRTCVTNSFIAGGPENSVFKEQLRLRSEMMIVRLPTIVVQDVILHGGELLERCNLQLLTLPVPIRRLASL